MPRPKRAQGRPGTAVIPTDWATSHRPVAEKAMTAAVAIRKPGTVHEWSEADNQTVEVLHKPYFTGASRIQALANQARVTVWVGEREVTASYLVEVSASVSPGEGDLVHVDNSDDLALIGRTLTIAQVVLGSERFARALFCTLD